MGDDLRSAVCLCWGGKTPHRHNCTFLKIVLWPHLISFPLVCLSNRAQKSAESMISNKQQVFWLWRIWELFRSYWMAMFFYPSGCFHPCRRACLALLFFLSLLLLLCFAFSLYISFVCLICSSHFLHCSFPSCWMSRTTFANTQLTWDGLIIKTYSHHFQRIRVKK